MSDDIICTVYLDLLQSRQDKQNTRINRVVSVWLWLGQLAGVFPNNA